MNVGFLVADVLGIVSFGATTAAATAAKAAVKTGVKVAAKNAAKLLGKSGLKTGARLSGKGALKAFKNSIDDIVEKAGKGKKSVTCKPIKDERAFFLEQALKQEQFKKDLLH